MSEFKRLQIDYSHYRESDKSILHNADPTKSDEALTAEDMQKLSTDQLNQIYQIYRSYSLDTNGSSVKSAQAKRIFDFVTKSAKPPEQYVRSVAKNNQFLLFGESHMSPKSRQFMASMVGTLKEEGFSYLAIEVDAQDQSIIDEYMKTENRSILSKYTWMNSEFIEILDAARKEGMNIVCIDDRAYHEQGKDRGSVDEAMFGHLKEKVFDKYPQAKVAIYIGNSHIDETEYLNFIQDGRIVEKPRKQGNLGYSLERQAKGKSHSITIVDSTAPDFDGLLRDGVGKPFAISLDSPLMHTIVRETSFKTTYGGAYDSLIGL